MILYPIAELDDRRGLSAAVEHAVANFDVDGEPSHAARTELEELALVWTNGDGCTALVYTEGSEWPDEWELPSNAVEVLTDNELRVATKASLV